jgi:hypothetical protein
MVDVDNLGLKHLAAAEGKKLVGEVCCTLAGLEDVLDFGAEGVIDGHLVEQQGAVTVDDGEEVVEVMGNASCQLADGFHFLGLAELVHGLFMFQFSLPLLADILLHANEMGYDPIVVPDGRD